MANENIDYSGAAKMGAELSRAVARVARLRRRVVEFERYEAPGILMTMIKEELTQADSDLMLTKASFDELTK